MGDLVLKFEKQRQWLVHVLQLLEVLQLKEGRFEAAPFNDTKENWKSCQGLPNQGHASGGHGGPQFKETRYRGCLCPPQTVLYFGLQVCSSTIITFHNFMKLKQNQILPFLISLTRFFTTGFIGLSVTTPEARI